jgi:FMN phosphatase YigB (HAD superfamily)
MNQQSAVRAVVFDLGKVLLDFDYNRVVQRIGAHCACPPHELLKLLDQSPLLHEFETGLITIEQFYERVCHGSGFRGRLEDFAEPFGDIFTPVAEMVKLHSALREADYLTALFSNTNELAIRHFEERYPFLKTFDQKFYSCRERLMKPAMELYRIVEKKLGLSGAAILYIDDRVENYEAGRAAGWDSILHISPEQTWSEVRARGVLQ